MSVFNNSTYFKLLNQQESEIINHAKDNLQLQYKKVSYPEFYNQCSKDGWLGRKVVALPLAAWSFFVQTTYHFALALMYGLPKLNEGDTKPLKANFFSIARDLQEAQGRLISIYDDTFGKYLIEEAQFHKQYYQSALLQEKVNSSNSPSTNTPPLTDSKSPSPKLALLTVEEFKLVFQALQHKYDNQT